MIHWVPMIVFTVFLSGAAVTVTVAETAESSGRLKWLFPDVFFEASSPVIAPEGTIFIAGHDDFLYAINPDGSLKWRFKTDMSSDAAPAIAPDSTIYIGDTGGRFYAVNPDSTLKWSYRTGHNIHGSAAVGSDGTVYIGSQDGFLYAFSPEDSLKWKCKAGRGTTDWLYEWYNIDTSPAVGHDGTIYVASRDSHVYAITPYGTIKWKFPVDHFFDTGSPSIGRDGTIYAGTHGLRLYAINPDGTLKWNYITGTCGNSSPVIAEDGTVYIGSNDGGKRCLYAFSEDGTYKWQYQTDGYINSSPVIGSDGTVYIPSGDGFVYAINPEGTLLWKYDTGNSIQSSPALAPDGTLYIGNLFGLHAIQTDSRGYQLGAPWPCMMHNNTRSVSSDTIVQPVLHAVRGRVALPNSTPIAGVAVSVSGLTTESDGNGYYSLFLPDGLYTIEIDAGSSEIPKSIDITIDGADITVYQEYWDKHTVRGRLAENGISLDGITVSVDETSTITDENGGFSFALNDGTFAIRFDVGENSFPDSIKVTVDGADVDLDDININTFMWRYEVGQWIHTYPVIAPDGAIIFGTHDNELVVLNSDGSLRHKYDLGLNDLHSTPSQAIDGTLYVPCWTSLNAYTQGGTLKWSFSVEENGIGAAPAVKGDGTLYVGSRRKLYALDPGGSRIWEFETGEIIGASPSIGRDGTVYFSCYDKHVYALNPDGSLKWKYETNSATTETPVIDSEGTIYFTNQDSHIYALNRDGTLKWKHSEYSYIPGSAVITSNNTLLAAVDEGYLIEFGIDGVLKWRHQFRDLSTRMPVIAPDGSAYIAMNADKVNGVRNGFLTAFRTNTRGYQKAAPWPCYMGNNSRTGTVGDTIVSVEGSGDNDDDKDGARPGAIELRQNFPNPFNPSTTISYTIPNESMVILDIYNTNGQKVRTLVSGMKTASTYTSVWNGLDDYGRLLGGGLYFVRLHAGKYLSVKKVTIIR